VRRPFLIAAAVAVVAASSGYFVARILSPPPGPGRIQPAAATAAELLGQRRPDFTLADVTGQAVSADRFDGRVLLVNFWATWCAPCVEEMPMLSQLQRDYAARGFSVVGIALDEPLRAREFAEELGIDYPLLFGLADAMVVGRRYGNNTGMLPYSVLVDASGIIRWTRLGLLDRSQVEIQLASVL
jgi:peroxiredoxin